MISKASQQRMVSYVFRSTEHIESIRHAIKIGVNRCVIIIDTKLRTDDTKKVVDEKYVLNDEMHLIQVFIQLVIESTNISFTI